MKTRLALIVSCCLSVGSVISTTHAQPMRLEATPQAPGPSLVTPLDGPSATQVQNQGSILAEIQKMIEAGADPSVIKAFIQNWSGRYSVSADEILRLHDIGASTEVLTTLIHRSAELQARPSSPAATSSSPSSGAGNTTAGYPQMATTPPPVVVAPYTSSYPAYTYSYIYPDYSYRYWSAPYSLSFGFGWPSYRSYYWGGRPWYGSGYHPGHSYGWRSGGYYGHGGPHYSRGFGGHGGGSYGRGPSHGSGGHGRR
jgi:hypothetical protein